MNNSTAAAPVAYIDHADTPAEILDVIGPRHPGGNLDRWQPSVPHLDVRAQTNNVTVIQHITVYQASPSPAPVAVPATQLEPRPIPAPDPWMPMPARRLGIGQQEINAVVLLGLVVTALIGVLVFVDMLVFIATIVLAVMAVAVVLVTLLSVATGKGCPGLHCLGCKG